MIAYFVPRIAAHRASAGRMRADGIIGNRPKAVPF
jgi:hypothetical protein